MKAILYKHKHMHNPQFVTASVCPGCLVAFQSTQEQQCRNLGTKFCVHFWNKLFDSLIKRKRRITKTSLFKFDPLKPHIYIVKLGFTGVYIIFLISAQNIDCGYSLEPPRRGASNEYPQSMCLSRSMKNIRIFYLKIFIFFYGKIFSIFE